MSGGIEESIFSNIESATGESFTDASVDTGDGGADGTVATNDRDLEQDQLEQQLGRRDDSSKQVDQQLSKPESKGKPGKEKVPDQDKEAAQGKPQSHNKHFAEQRLQTTANRLREVNQGLQKQNETLVQQLAGVQALNGIPQKFGLNNDEVLGGLEYVALLKSDPVKAARKAIEVSMARGANLREIMNDEFVPSVTLNATRQLLDERLGQLQGNPQQDQGVNPQQQEAQQQANQFLADYPDAEMHSEVVAEQMKKVIRSYQDRGQNISPYVAAEMAWNAIADYAQRNQLDLSQPLGPQVQARQQTPQRPNPVGQSNQQRRPMPNGGNAPVQSRSNLAKADDSTRSIVRQAMIESGYNFN